MRHSVYWAFRYGMRFYDLWYIWGKFSNNKYTFIFVFFVMLNSTYQASTTVLIKWQHGIKVDHIYSNIYILYKCPCSYCVHSQSLKPLSSSGDVIKATQLKKHKLTNIIISSNQISIVQSSSVVYKLLLRSLGIFLCCWKKYYCDVKIPNCQNWNFLAFFMITGV